MKYTILALALCAPLAACDQGAGNATTGNSSGAVWGVKDVERDMLAAYKALDPAKVASFYTADADIMVPNMAVTKGSDAAKALAAQFKDPNFSLGFDNTRTEVAASGDMAFTHGTFHVTYTNPATKKMDMMDGTYVTVFRKQADGSWKVVEDISTPGPTATRPQDAPAPGNG
jgi:uncharacterized protein (TIGR02246 family)